MISVIYTLFLICSKEKLINSIIDSNWTILNIWKIIYTCIHVLMVLLTVGFKCDACWSFIPRVYQHYPIFMLSGYSEFISFSKMTKKRDSYKILQNNENKKRKKSNKYRRLQWECSSFLFLLLYLKLSQCSLREHHLKDNNFKNIPCQIPHAVTSAIYSVNDGEF